MNVVVLQGRLSSPPRGRVLPSGDRLGSFEVTVRHPGERAETVPVVWLDPPEAVLGLAAGDEGRGIDGEGRKAVGEGGFREKERGEEEGE